MKYYQLSFTLEKSIRGNYEMPHTISIDTPNFLKYILDNNKTISMYFENRKNLYEEMPDNLRGKLIKRKRNRKRSFHSIHLKPFIKLQAKLELLAWSV